MAATVSPAVPPATPPEEAAVSAAPLLALLASIRRQAGRWIWIESLALALLAALAAAWLSLAIDWLIEPPAWVRGCILAAAMATIVWILVTRLVTRLSVPLTDESLALAIERTHPGFRDGLSTAVAYARARRSATVGDLAGEDESVDRELVDRTIAGAVALVDRVRPEALFRRARLMGVALTALVTLAATAAAATSSPGVATAWARRLLLLADDPWPRRVTLEAVDFAAGVRTVARGVDVDVMVLARAQGTMPEVVELRTRGRDGWRTERMGTRGGPTDAGQLFGHVLKRIDDDLMVEVRGGDARLRGLRIVVADPPAIAEVRIIAALPEYLGGGSRELVASRLVQVPRGAAVEFACTSTKPLAAATLAVRPAGGDARAERVITSLEPGAAETRTISGQIPAIDADTAVLVHLTDTVGLVNRDPVVVVFSAVPDARPEVAVRLVGISSAVTPQAMLSIEGVISDDHALGNAAVMLAAGELERTLPIARVRGGEPMVELPAAQPEVVPLAGLGLPVGARLEVVVSARDTCSLDAEANEGRSDTWTLDVVSPETLRAMLEAREILLRRRFEAAIDDFAKAREIVTAEPRTDDAGSSAPALARCGEATVRASGETSEIAAEFRGIARELANNALLTPEIEARLLTQIAEPLSAVVAGELDAVARACRATARNGGSSIDRRSLVRLVDLALARLRAVLERMLELESVNEVIERLRGVIRTQEEIREETLERQRKRGREALESP
ncbi:MAG: hypothetical protein K8S94_06035 [Planctomycetia bacterium]|nr:hypothetical protein [Planctomycetia bacterium]